MKRMKENWKEKRYDIVYDCEESIQFYSVFTSIKPRQGYILQAMMEATMSNLLREKKEMEDELERVKIERDEAIRKVRSTFN